MKSKISLAVKLIVTGALLLLADITLRYVIERIDLFKVRPVTIPNYNDSHFINILGSFPYLFVVIGWSYILVTLIYDYYKKKSEFSWYINTFIGFLLFMTFFIIYWLFDRGGIDNGISLLKEGILVYLILGLLIELIFNFFKRTKLI